MLLHFQERDRDYFSYTYCGDVNSTTEPRHVNFQDLVVTFRTDASNPMRGFLLRYDGGWNRILSQCRKRVSGVLCDRNMNVKINGEVCRTVARLALAGAGDMDSEKYTGKQLGGARNENASMDVRCYQV